MSQQSHRAPHRHCPLLPLGLWCFRGLVIGLLWVSLTTSAAAQTVVNGDFESCATAGEDNNPPGWTVSTTANTGCSSQPPAQHSGSWRGYASAGQYLYQAVSLTGGVAYTFSVLAMVGGATQSASLLVSSTWNGGTTYCSPAPVTSTTTWTLMQCSYTPAADITVYITLKSTSDSAAARFDDVTIIRPPTSVTAADVAGDQGGAINVSWTPSSATGVTEQRVYRATTSGGPYTLVQTYTNNTTTSFANTGLTNGTTYYYVVRVWNLTGSVESVNSSQVSAVPVDNVAPAAPTAVSAVDTPSDAGGSITLNWTVSTATDVTQQRVYRGTVTGGPYTLVTTLTGNTATSYADTGLTNGTTYYYVLRAYDGTQESANSSQASAAPVNNGGSSTQSWQQNINGTDLYYNAGKIGIGATNPGSVLHLITNSGDDASGIRLERTSATTGRYNLKIGPAGDLVISETGIGDRLTLQKTTGNVGIGITGPGSMLHVNVPDNGAVVPTLANAVSQAGVRFESGSGSTCPGQTLFGNNAGANYFWMQVGKIDSGCISGTGNLLTSYSLAINPLGGNVGIGTTNPVGKLHVRNGDLYLDADSGPTMRFMNGTTERATIRTVGATSDLIVQTANAERLRVTTTGIQVTGDVTVTGNIAAKYQDVAEWVPAPAPLPSGTVVVLDIEQINQVVASTHAYDTKVAGVISAMPGLLLGIGGEGKVKVATTGRVKVRVDAGNGAIKVGDLLVTSDVPGVAMGSKPVDLSGVPMHRPGTIVGKALEPLKEGQGEILVLLSLQ